MSKASKEFPRPIHYQWFSYRVSYYLKRPWKWFGAIRIGISNMRMRQKCCYDWVALWNVDTFLLELIPNMLRHLSEKACGWPDNATFPTFEVYKEWMCNLAIPFEVLGTISFSNSDKKFAREQLEKIPESEFPVIGELRRECFEALDDMDWEQSLLNISFKHLAQNLRVLWD